MNIHKLDPRPLTQKETEVIEHFRYYFDFQKTFALIGPRTAAVLGESRAEDGENLASLRQAALGAMSVLLESPPDFSAYVMDDGFGLAEMDFGIYAVSPSPLSDEEIAANRMGVAAALAARSACLEACSAGEIIAIVDEA